MSDTLLVIGIHREELAFGDRVAEILDQTAIDIMRIPTGISHSRTARDDAFYFETRHREIYLQLRQQVKNRYRLVVDLHCGIRSQGMYAEVFSSAEPFRQGLNALIAQKGWRDQVRVIKIVAQGAAPSGDVSGDDREPAARTWIPEKVWTDRSYRYVGLEVYLADGALGTPTEWSFARELIEAIRSCGDD